MFIKGFWDLYNHAGPLWGLSLVWLAVSLPFIAAAFLAYLQFPGLSLGLLLVLPFLKLNPGSVALAVCAHQILYHRRKTGIRQFFSAWRNALASSLIWLVFYSVMAGGLFFLARYFTGPGGTVFRPVMLLPALHLVLYAVLLLMQVFFAPQEAFRHRPFPELLWQSLLLLSGNTGLAAAVLGTELVLAFGTIRFGLVGVIFIPISVVLGLNLLYYMYGMFGKMEKVMMPGNRFRDLLKPFGRKTR